MSQAVWAKAGEKQLCYTVVGTGQTLCKPKWRVFKKLQLDMSVTCGPSAWDTEGVRTESQDSQGYHSDSLFQVSQRTDQPTELACDGSNLFVGVNAGDALSTADTRGSVLTAALAQHPRHNTRGTAAGSASARGDGKEMYASTPVHKGYVLSCAF